MSSDMGWIAPAVARDTRVCVYDRAGRGWSDPADTAQDATQIATDLHTLLQRANVPGPYVLAGHSFGGLYVLTYAAQYPNEVAGMVLIDSTGTAYRRRPRRRHAAGSYDPMGRISALVSSTARFGLMRLVVEPRRRHLATAVRRMRCAPASRPASSLRSTIDEYLQGRHLRRGGRRAHHLRRQASVRADCRRRQRPGWMPKQNKLAGLSTNSAHHVVDGATHPDLVVDETSSGCHEPGNTRRRRLCAHRKAAREVTAAMDSPSP